MQRHPCHRIRRGHFAFVLAAAAAAAIAFPEFGSAEIGHFGGCTISWAAPVDGSWFEPANWSPAAVPTSADDVCITQPGSYTVSVDGAGGVGNSLTLGGLGSSPTLSLVGTFLSRSGLTLTGSVDIGSTATVQLTSQGAPADAALAATAVQNGGTLAVALGSGGNRTLSTSLTNSGAVTIDRSVSFDGPSATWLNQGSTVIGDGQALSLRGGQTFTNGGGGSLTEVGSGQLQLTGSTLNFGSGSFTGATPIALDDSSLNLTNGTAAAFLWHGTSGQLSGNLSSVQTLTAVGLCSGAAQVNATSSFNNAGTIELTANGCDGPGASIAYAPYTLTNTGTIRVSAGSGGSRSITGNLTNQGTVSVARSLDFSGTSSTWLNRGALTIGDGTAVSLPGGQTFTNTTGGSIATGNSGQVRLVASTFNHGDGTISWTHPSPIGSYPGVYPVLLDRSNLNVTSSNSVSFLWHGVGGQLTGGLPGALQEVAVEGTCSAPAGVDVASNFTNAGFIELAAAGCASDASINMPGATLTNLGLINVLSGSTGGARVINGNLSQQKNFGLDHKVTLQVNGNFAQIGRTTIFRSLVFGDSDFGKVSVSGAATLNGTLSILSLASYKPSVGATLALITSGTRSGTFRKITGTSFGARYLAPVYSPTGLTLVGGEASISVSPTSAPRGTSVAITGAGFPANDTVKLTFKDAAGTVTTLPSAQSDSSGSFSTNFIVPAGAAVGKAKVTAKSNLTGASTVKSLTVT